MLPWTQRRLCRICSAPILVLVAFGASAQDREQAFNFDDMKLPPGFTASTYISGAGFDHTEGDIARLAPADERDAPGIPAIVTINFGADGRLYFGKTANRITEMTGSQSAPIYRVPPGPSLDITQETERDLLFGPGIADPDEMGINAEGEVFVASTERNREWEGVANHVVGRGAVYKISPTTGEAELFAGGDKHPELFLDPEAITFDEEGNVYVADDDKGIVAKLDSEGNVIDAAWVDGPERWRQMSYDPRGFIWLGSDARLDEPHGEKYGRIYRASLPDGELELLHAGTLGAFNGVGPGGNLYVGSRRSGRIYVITPEGESAEFATFDQETGKAAIRIVAFPPDTDATRELGIAGDMFAMVFPETDYPVREIIRISGPFEEWARAAVDPEVGTPALQ